MAATQKMFFESTVATGMKATFFYGDTIAKKAIRPKKVLDYYAFGALMPGREFTAANYRYGCKQDKI